MSDVDVIAVGQIEVLGYDVGGIPGPDGAAGMPGGAINILGTQSNQGALPTSGNTAGDAWTLDDTGHMWVWDGAAWLDAGQFQGPQGNPGIDGTGTVNSVNGESPDGAGDVTWLPTWAQVSAKPDVIGAGTTAANARTAIGAGTSNLALGTTSSTALKGNTALLKLGTTSSTALKGDTAIPSIPSDVDAVESLVGDTKLWRGTQTAYDGLTPASDTIYVIQG